jgi:hypothetical protein
MCGEDVMATVAVKLWWLNHGKVWVKLRWLKPIRHKKGFWWGEMLTLVVKPQWVRYKLEEAIEIPCNDLLTSHQRKCEYVWPTWSNGDVSHLKTDDEITTDGECVQPL